MTNNHGFADGNKRTTLLLAITLLERSSYRLRPGDARENVEDALEEIILKTACGEMPFAAIVSWFKERTRRH
jgi:prophage maintenance system killer protein